MLALEFAGSEKRELQTIKQIEKLLQVRRMFVNNSPSNKLKKPDLKFEVELGMVTKHKYLQICKNINNNKCYLQ